MSTRPGRLEVVIDELVLHGFDPRHRDRIADAARAELAAVLAGWQPAAGGSAVQLEAGSFSLLPAAPPAAVGRGVARQIGQLLTGMRKVSGQPQAPRAPAAEGRG